MRMRYFIAVCWAILALSNIVPQSLSACERCRGGQMCQPCDSCRTHHSCQPSDDRGLLDRIDSILIHRRPQLSPVTIPRLPSFDGSLCRSMVGRVACRCGAGPGCGCELSEPTCGCELHQVGRCDTRGHTNSGTATLPQPAPIELSHEQNSEAYSTPSSSSPPGATKLNR